MSNLAKAKDRGEDKNGNSRFWQGIPPDRWPKVPGTAQNLTGFKQKHKLTKINLPFQWCQI